MKKTHDAALKAKVALEALKGEKTMASSDYDALWRAVKQPVRRPSQPDKPVEERTAGKTAGDLQREMEEGTQDRRGTG